MAFTVALSLPDGRQRSLFSLLLADAGIELISCEDPSEIAQLLAFRRCDLCVTTSRGPREDRSALMDIKRVAPRSRVLMICEKAALEHALLLLREGLDDILILPIKPRTAVAVIRRLLPDGTAASERAPGTNALATGARPNTPRSYLTAESAAMRACLEQLRRLRDDAYSVLVRGEPGSEFELFAREVLSFWGCPETQMRSLRIGEGGEGALNTFFDPGENGRRQVWFVPGVHTLDEAQQDLLIDFLKRLRADRGAQARLRLVFAAAGSNAVDSEDLFVEELAFLVPTVIDLPPLRRRTEDIPALARSVLLDLTALFPQIRVRAFHPSAIDWLQRAPWRGNYEEFVQRIHRSVLQCTCAEVMPRDFQCFFPLAGDPPTDRPVAAARLAQ